MHIALLGAFAFFTLSWPTPVTALAIAAAVYLILQAAKASPWLGPHITGWWALLLNAALTILAFLATVPATQLYSWNTLTTIIITILSGAGIHGSVQKLITAPKPATTAVFIVVCLGFASAAVPARAQTGIPVVVSAAAGNFHYNGSSYADTHEVEAIDLMNLGAKKSSILSVAAHQVVVPGASINIYGFGTGFQPDISGLLAKTNIPTDSLTFGMDVFGGVATLLNGVNNSAWEGRASFAYALTPNASLTAGYAGGGMIGQHGFYEISAGLNFFPNPSANPSAIVQKLIRKHNAARAASALVK